MTTRFNAKAQTRFNVPGLPSGFQSKSAPSDFTVPPVGIVDVDKSLFELFDKEIPFAVADDDGELKKVPVVFAAGEKWALQKRRRALRDRNGTLILPLITVVRTTIRQAADSDITGRGINQQTGEIVIHRRLDKSDRAYQGLINRLLIRHQANLAVNPAAADASQLTTLRPIGDMADDPVVREGGLLVPNRKNNIYETIVVPAPQFFTALYDVTIWVQYTSHMNQLLEQLMSSFLPQGNSWRLDTDKGYWFIAYVDENTYTSDSNADDYAQTERIIKYKLVIRVPGYVMASKTPGAPVPIKRYVSSPIVSFQTSVDVTGDDGSDSITDPFLGADDPTLPLDPGDSAPSRRNDLRSTTSTRLYPNVEAVSPDDPANKSRRRGVSAPRYRKVPGLDENGDPVTRLMRIKHENKAAGETVLTSDASLDGLTFVITGD